MKTTRVSSDLAFPVLAQRGRGPVIVNVGDKIERRGSERERGREGIPGFMEREPVGGAVVFERFVE